MSTLTKASAPGLFRITGGLNTMGIQNVRITASAGLAAAALATLCVGCATADSGVTFQDVNQSDAAASPAQTNNQDTSGTLSQHSVRTWGEATDITNNDDGSSASTQTSTQTNATDEEVVILDSGLTEGAEQVAITYDLGIGESGTSDKYIAIYERDGEYIVQSNAEMTMMNFHGTLSGNIQSAVLYPTLAAAQEAVDLGYIDADTVAGQESNPFLVLTIEIQNHDALYRWESFHTPGHCCLSFSTSLSLGSQGSFIEGFNAVSYVASNNLVPEWASSSEWRSFEIEPGETKTLVIGFVAPEDVSTDDITLNWMYGGTGQEYAFDLDITEA